MASHRDAEIADVVVVLSNQCESNVDHYLQTLRNEGLEVDECDTENLTVSGTIDAAKIGTLRDKDWVNYVRISETYIADFPPGDPRDHDGQEEDPEEDED